MPYETQLCRGCSGNHLPNQIFCRKCDSSDSGAYYCEKCDEICVNESLFCAEHENDPSFQKELMQEIKNMMQEINGLKTMMVRMSDHFDIVVSRLDLLEKQ